MIRGALLGLALGVVGAGCAERESAPRAPAPPSTGPGILTVTTPGEPRVAPGTTVTARVRVRVDDAYHVMANPPSEDYLVPLRLELEGADGVDPGAPVYPPGATFAVDGIDKPLATYEGTVTIAVPLAASADARPGRRTLRGRLHFQGCSRHTCLIPSSMPVALEVEVAN